MENMEKQMIGEVELYKLRENPENPREISEEKFGLLVKSVLVFPRMLWLAPIVYDEAGVVRWDDIKMDIDALHQYDWGRAEGFNANSSEKRAHFYGMTMAAYMKWLWNNPQSGQNPYKLFEGALVPSGKDENGNLIYKYNGATF